MTWSSRAACHKQSRFEHVQLIGPPIFFLFLPDVLSNLCFSVLPHQLAPFVHSLFL